MCKVLNSHILSLYHIFNYNKMVESCQWTIYSSLLFICYPGNVFCQTWLVSHVQWDYKHLPESRGSTACDFDWTYCSVTYICLFGFVDILRFLLWIHARIRSWNQPVLSNKDKVSCSRKQRGTLRVRRAFHCATPPLNYSASIKDIIITKLFR